MWGRISSGTASTAVSTHNAIPAPPMLVGGKLNRADSVAEANTSYGIVMARGIYAGTTDMTAGSTALTSGVIYLFYEA
jgi:hypothetical protein